MRQSVWLGSVVAAFLVGSMASQHAAQGDLPSLTLDQRVAALEAWKASAGVFTQDTKTQGRPWTFAPPTGDILIQSVSSSTDPSLAGMAGKVTLISGTGLSQSMVRLDGSRGKEEVFVRAAKDLDAEVTNNQTWRVGNNESRTVTQTETTHLGSASWNVAQTSVWKTGLALDVESGATADVKSVFLRFNGGGNPVQTIKGQSPTVMAP